MKFDIILPTSGRKSLQLAVASIFQQEYTDWQLYIVNDSGNAVDLRIEDPAFQTTLMGCEGPHNDSGAFARNAGIRASSNPWIAYIDDDDVWLPNHLTILSQHAMLHPEVNMVRTFGQSFSWRHKSPRSSELVRKLGPVNSQDILTVGMAHKRELFDKTAGWQPVDNHDRLLWAEMLAAGGMAVVAQEVTFEFER